MFLPEILEGIFMVRFQGKKYFLSFSIVSFYAAYWISFSKTVESTYFCTQYFRIA